MLDWQTGQPNAKYWVTQLLASTVGAAVEKALYPCSAEYVEEGSAEYLEEEGSAVTNDAGDAGAAGAAGVNAARNNASANANTALYALPFRFTGTDDTKDTVVVHIVHNYKNNVKYYI